MLRHRILLQMGLGGQTFPSFPGSGSSSSKDSPSSPPPPDDSSPPPPTDSSPPPPDNSSPPPPKDASSPPPKESSQPPPTDSSQPPTKSKSSPPPPDSSPPPASKSPPPAPSGDAPAPSSPPVVVASPPPPADTPPAKDPPPASVASPSPPAPAAPVANSPPSLTPLAPLADGTKPSPASNSSFFAPPALTTPEPVSSTSSSSSSSNSGAIVGGLIGGGFLLAFIAVLVVCCIRKKRKKQYYDSPASQKGDYYNWNNAAPKDHIVKMQSQPSWGSPPMSSEFYSPGGPKPAQSPMNIGPNQSSFTYDQLAAATSGFSQENLLGQGGFGYVHKGVLPSGKEVAVKSLKAGSGQGEREFQAEVEIISRVHHRHLVSLVGYCIADQSRMLVYEFVPNKTLEFHLHGKGQPVMDWPTRMRIALGSAKGLGYLHEDCHPKIIHRDIKAANILLDENFEAMVADFGLAKLSSDNNTHVSTRVMGTFGYLAPEYASSGKLTDKSDVFSFGVMLLELITGRKPVDHTSNIEDSLVDWARPLMGRALEEGNYNGLADPLLENVYNIEEMACMVACAAASIRHSARRRPKMIQIVRALEGDSSLDELIDGPKPVHNSSGGSNGSSNGTSLYDTVAYNADIMKFRKMVLTENAPSGEFGATSNLSSSSSELTDSGAQRHKV